jgi:hypothetical protein
MTEAIDRAGESFRRRFRAREFESVCVLTFPEDFNPGTSDALSLWNAGVESAVRGGIAGFVFDLTEFSRHVDVEERLGHLVTFWNSPKQIWISVAPTKRLRSRFRGTPCIGSRSWCRYRCH